ncbi:MAG: hypothetical protein AAGL08_21075 [Cyanobacteria bacterium J06573_11]
MNEYMAQYGEDFSLDEEGDPSKALAAYISHFLEEPKVREEAGFPGLLIGEEGGTEEMFQSISEKVWKILEADFPEAQLEAIAKAINTVGESY